MVPSMLWNHGLWQVFNIVKMTSVGHSLRIFCRNTTIGQRWGHPHQQWPYSQARKIIFQTPCRKLVQTCSLMLNFGENWYSCWIPWPETLMSLHVTIEHHSHSHWQPGINWVEPSFGKSANKTWGYGWLQTLWAPLTCFKVAPRASRAKPTPGGFEVEVP